MSTRRAWLLLALSPGDRQHAGNEGYDDAPAALYRYDSLVPNSRQLRPGDLVVLRDRERMLGYASIDQIDRLAGKKRLLKCPTCGRTRLRRRAGGEYRCSSCKGVTSAPNSIEVDVDHYTARYEGTFVEAAGAVPLAALVEACPRYNQNLAMQRLDVAKIGGAVGAAIRRHATAATDERTEQEQRRAVPQDGAGNEGSRRLGRPYSATQAPSVPERREPFDIDPDLIDRGTRSHHAVVQALAAWVESHGLVAFLPDGGPEYDLAWEEAGVTYVAEVKSTTDANEEKQLRLGLGQVLRYQHAVRAQSRGERTVVAVLVAEREPRDASWRSLCDSLGVRLWWPGAFGA